MTPGFEKALRHAEQDHFNKLSGDLGRVSTETTNKYAANGMLHSGAYVDTLRSGKLKALEQYGDGLAETYVRLASKADLLARADAEGWLVARLERALGGKGVVDGLIEHAKAVRIPQDEFKIETERGVEALRSRVLNRLQGLIAEAVLQGQPPPPSSASTSTKALVQERLKQLDQLEAELSKTPYALGRHIEPLNRWLETSARLFAAQGVPDIGKRLARVSYMGTGDPLLDGPDKMAAHRQFLLDLLQQAERDPGVLQPNEGAKSGDMAKDPRRVAVIHGRNSAAKDGVFAFLWALGLSPVEWEQAVRETGKGSPYNREVVEQLFVATQAVLVLLTGDEDIVLREPFRNKSGDASLRRQARGNVFFEAGMAFVLHPDRTILVEIGEQELPSDLDGLNGVRFDGSAGARLKLRGRLETAGCEVQATDEGLLNAGAEHFERAMKM